MSDSMECIKALALDLAKAIDAEAAEQTQARMDYLQAALRSLAVALDAMQMEEAE